MKKLGLVITIICGAILLYATSDFPNWGEVRSPASLHVSPHYIKYSVEETDVPNIVTSVLADYRGFDTMFETTVIFCAGLACFLLLRVWRRDESEDDIPEEERGIFYRHVPTGIVIQFKREDVDIRHRDFELIDSKLVPYDLIIKTVCRVLIPFIQLFALYVVAHGDFSPGGGFQGGVIFGASIILLAISFNLRTATQKMNEKLLAILSAVGVFIYAGIGWLCLLLGGNFLNYGKLASILPVDPIRARALGMLGVEIGVGIAVMAVMIIIYINIASAGRHDEGL